MTDEPNGPTPRASTKRQDDAATKRLFDHNPAALALHNEGKKLRREKARKDWYAKNGGAK